MIRFHCLGQVALTQDGAPMPGAASQPRRLALLAVLARAAPRAVAREKLLALLWPDADEERGRRALNQALYAIRTDLGSEEVITGTRDLRLNPEWITADVAEYEAALAEGQPEAAAGLYAGPFLDGMSLPGAEEFERWMEEERRLLATSYRELLLRLADGATRRHDHTAAVAWARKAAGQNPTDGPVALKLMWAMAAAGDRSGAIRHATIYETLLRQELDLPPEPEVMALAAKLRREMDAGAADPPRTMATPMATQPAAANSEPEQPSAPTASAAAPPPPPRRRPFGWVALGGLVVVVVALLAWPGRQASTVDLRAIAVAALENRSGDPALDLVGPMVADWVTQGLAATGLVRVVDNRREGANAPPEPSEASHLVSGNFYREGDSLRILVRISSVPAGAVEQALAPVTVSLQRPTDALEPLRQRITGALALMFDDRLNNFTATTSNPPTWEAYQEFLLGMRDFGRDYEANVAHFLRAATLDSTYWQATLWAGITSANLRRYPFADSVLTSVSAHRDQLGPYDLANLDYFHGGFVRGDWETSYRGARRMVELAPDASHALFALGLTASLTRRTDESLAALERMDLSRGWGREWAGRALNLMVRGHHLQGNREAEIDAARRMAAVDPATGWLQAPLALALAAAGRHAELDSALARTRSLPTTPRSWVEFSQGGLLLQVARELAAHQQGDSGRRYYREALAWFSEREAAGDRSPLILRGMAQGSFESGNLEAASQWYRELQAAEPDGLDAVARLGLVALRSGDTVTAAAALTGILAVDRPYAFGQAPLWAARLLAGMGRRDEAVQQLHRALREGHSRHYLFHSEPDFTPLRSYPPFEALLGAIPSSLPTGGLTPR